MRHSLRPLLAALALLTACAATPPPPPEAPASPTQAAAAPAASAPPASAEPAPATATPLPLSPTAPPPTAPPATATPAPAAGLPPPTATPAFPEARIAEETLRSLTLLRTAGLGGAIYAAVAPDNRTLAVATTAGLALFELPSLRHLRLDPIAGGASRVEFSPDGATMLVTTGFGGALERRRLADGALESTETPEPQPNSAYVREFLSPSGDVRATLPVPDSVPTPGVTLTRVADGATIYADEDSLTVSFSPDGATAALVSVAGDVRLIDLGSGASVGELALPEYWGVGFTPDAQTLVTTGRSVWLWDVVAGTSREAPGSLGRSAVGAQFGGQQRVRASADGSILTVEGAYGYFEFSDLAGSAYRVSGGELTPAWESGAGGWGIINYETYAGAISPASDATARTDDGVTLELHSGGELLRTVQVPELVGALAFSPDGALLAVGDRAGGVRLLPFAGGAERRLGQMGGAVRGLVFSPDGSLLGARTPDGVIEVWRVADGSVVARVQDAPAGAGSYSTALDSFLFTADGELLISWDREAVRFYALADSRLLHVLPQGASGAAIGPRRRILALLVDGRVQLWGIP